MASIRRISIGNSNASGLSNELEAIGKQLNPNDENTVLAFQNAYGTVRNNQEATAAIQDAEDAYRRIKAEREGRLNGPLSFDQLKSAERFIEEAYFSLPIEYKNKEARDEVVYARLNAFAETITEIKVELDPPKEPLREKNNITVILLKAPENQTANARVWFENIKSKLDHTILFNIEASDSDISTLIGNFQRNEEVRVYVERNYSAIHWKTIKRNETKIISEEIESENIFWDDYPLFSNIQNEVFLREKESTIDCNFIEELLVGQTPYEKLINPLNFIKEESGWYRTDENGQVLNFGNQSLDIDYESLLTSGEDGKLLIDNFFKILNASEIETLLNTPNAFYKVEDDKFLEGNSISIQHYNDFVKPFIKYKLADKILKVLNKTNKFINDSKQLKLEIGIFKQLEKEGFLNDSNGENANVRVFYIKDEECGEIKQSPSSKVVFEKYLQENEISYKEISLSDGIENLPLEGIKSLLINNDKKFYYIVNNFIMKKFKNKDFMLKYYYNYIVEKLETNIKEEFSRTFSLPRNLIIKTNNGYVDIYELISNSSVLKWGDSQSNLLEIYFNNINESWLNSDYHCIGYISNKNDLDNLYVIEHQNNSKNFLYSKIFPWQLVKEEFEISAEEYNENYHFTFYNLISKLFHEHIHAMQRLGSNLYVRNRADDSKEVLFQNFESEDAQFLLLEENGRKKFFYLGRFIYSALKNDFLEDYSNVEEFDGFSIFDSYENAIELYSSEQIIEGIDKNQYISYLLEEVYQFYKRFKGFALIKGDKSLGSFITNLLKLGEVTFYGLNFIIEGLAILLTKKAFSKSFNILNETEAKAAKHFYFLSSSSLYRDYLDFMEKFEIYLETVNPDIENEKFKILDFFSTTDLSNYVKDDYFKQEEKIEENFKTKTIFYNYGEIPDFKEVFANNNRFNKFNYQLVERNLKNNRLVYISRIPNETIQSIAAPQVSPRREEPRHLEAERQRAIIEQSRRNGAQLQNQINESSNMQKEIQEDLSDLINTPFR